MTSIALTLLWAPVQAFPTQSQVGVSRSSSACSVLTPPTALQVSSSDNTNDFSDWEGLDKKNASRKKFGLKPMTPEQYLENDVLVQQMVVEQAAAQQQLAAQAATRQQQAASKAAAQQKKFVPGFLEKMMGHMALPDACESNFDCERPKVCCDFGAAKVCCAGGQRMASQEYILVPVPVDVSDNRSYN